MSVPCKLLFGLAAMLLVVGAAGAQDRGKPPANVDCDMKTIEKGTWCAKCDKFLEKSDLKDGKHKDENCGEKPLEVEVCVKKCYEGCHKGPQEKPYS